MLKLEIFGGKATQKIGEVAGLLGKGWERPKRMVVWVSGIIERLKKLCLHVMGGGC